MIVILDLHASYNANLFLSRYVPNSSALYASWPITFQFHLDLTRQLKPDRVSVKRLSIALFCLTPLGIRLAEKIIQFGGQFVEKLFLVGDEVIKQSSALNSTPELFHQSHLGKISDLLQGENLMDSDYQFL